MDPTDNHITSLQVSDKILAFTTKQNNLFLYQRGEHKINYLLKKVVIPSGQEFVLSNQISYLYTFSLDQAEAVSISQPTLALTNVTANNGFNITATSQAETCQVKVEVQFVKDSSVIIDKKHLEDSSYSVDPTSGLTLNLKNYYGGSNLQYKLEDVANSDFKAEIKQVESYDLPATFPKPEKSAVLAISNSSFFYIGINSIKENMVYTDVCQVTKGVVECEEYWKSRVPIDLMQSPVGLIEVAALANGEYYVFWTYLGSTFTGFFEFNKKAFSMTLRGPFRGLSMSSIKVG